MKKAAAIATIATVCTTASAELVSTVSLDEVSRFTLMNITSLTAQANADDHQAQFFLAKRLQQGEGVAKDSKMAAYWYTRAAKNGIAPAQLNLGIMYLKGDGVAVDQQKARTWLEKAAHLGDNRASFALAILDEKEQKLVDAYKWYDLSAREVMLDETVRHRAKDKIGQLALNLSSSDIEKATSSANAWFQTK